MKRILVIAFGLLASCSGLPRQVGTNLVGNWRYEDQLKRCDYTFAGDGTFRGDVISDGKTISQFHGKWTVKDRAVLYTYEGDRMHRIAPGTTDRDKLISLAADKLTIEAADGSRRTYRREH